MLAYRKPLSAAATATGFFLFSANTAHAIPLPCNDEQRSYADKEFVRIGSRFVNEMSVSRIDYHYTVDSCRFNFISRRYTIKGYLYWKGALAEDDFRVDLEINTDSQGRFTCKATRLNAAARSNIGLFAGGNQFTCEVTL